MSANLWKKAKEAMRAAIAYDAAIQRYAAKGQSWVEGDDLDALYATWVDASRATLAAMERADLMLGYVVEIDGIDKPGGGRYFHRSTNDGMGIPKWGRPALLLLLPEEDR